MILSAPTPFTLALDDGEIAGLHWENPQAARVLFAHANGFCAAAYTPLFNALHDRFDIIALDLRGHGRSRLPTNLSQLTDWSIYAEDIKAVIAKLDRKPDCLAGHSLGGTSTLIAGQSLDQRLPIVVIDPVILPQAVYWAYQTPLREVIRRQIGMGERARRRTHRWASTEKALEHFKIRKPYDDWVGEALAGYLQDGLRDTDTGVELACAPHWEAANFEAQALNPLRNLKSIAKTTRVLKAERESTVWNDAGLRARGVQITTLESVGHLMPMTHPDRVADWIRTTADALGIIGSKAD